jgi:DNA processing protein
MTREEEDRAVLVCFLAVYGIGIKSIEKWSKQLNKDNIALRDVWEDPLSHSDYLGMSTKQVYGLVKLRKKYSIESYYDYLSSNNIWHVLKIDTGYPSLLQEGETPPFILYGKGDIRLLAQEGVAVVGTRHMTEYGQKAVQKIVPALARAGLVINSGMMYGVDAEAHRSALAVRGRTTAVLGYSLTHQSQDWSRQLMAAILDGGGCIVTEYPPGFPVHARHFALRNRIVAGLSKAVLVVEAAKKSGSHITAESAVKAGRSVLAVPGSIFNPYSDGTAWLVNQGAKLVTSAADVYEELWPERANPTDSTAPKYLQLTSGDQRSICEALSIQTLTTPALAQVTRLDPNVLMITLTELELQEYIVQTSHGWRLR